MPESTTIFLAQNGAIKPWCRPSCDQQHWRRQAHLRRAEHNHGGNAAVEVAASTGVAPSTSLSRWTRPLRRARAQGTNLYRRHRRGRRNQQRHAYQHSACSPNAAINVPPLIRVFMNYRDSTRAGQIYPARRRPRPPPPQQGLWDIVLDPVRNWLHHQRRLQPDRSVRHRAKAIFDANSCGATAAPDGNGT